MVKRSSSLCSALVLLAITYDVASATNISYQIGEFNSKLTYLQGRLDLFDYITDGNVSVLQHRVEINESQSIENLTKQMNETNAKLNTLEDKINALVTAVTNLVSSCVHSCVDAFARPLLNRGSGVYNILHNGWPFDVYCMADPKEDLPWTVVQRRVDGAVDFYRNWTEYQRGFGDLDKNFFIGLDKLHWLTTKGEPQELWVMLTDANGISAHAYYDRFAIGNEAEKYPLNVLGKYSGDAGDSLSNHKAMNFSTYDKVNNLNCSNCAEHFKSAWWFGDCGLTHCHQCQLNGVYGSTQYWGGLNWIAFRKDSGLLKYAHMAIRPARK